MNKFFIIVISAFIIFINNAFACSGKNQLHVVFTSNDNNVSHTQIRAFSKSVFSDVTLSEEIHSFVIDTNHAKGTMIFDVSDEEQRENIIKKINGYLKQHHLKLVRLSYEKLLEKQ